MIPLGIENTEYLKSTPFMFLGILNRLLRGYFILENKHIGKIGGKLVCLPLETQAFWYLAKAV